MVHVHVAESKLPWALAGASLPRRSAIAASGRFIAVISGVRFKILASIVDNKSVEFSGRCFLLMKGSFRWITRTATPWFMKAVFSGFRERFTPGC